MQTTAQQNAMGQVNRDTSEIIIDYLKIITQEDDYSESMMKAMKAMSEFVIADRIYLLEQKGRLDSRIFEWCAEGVSPRIAQLREVSDSDLELFVNAFRGCDIIYAETLNQLGIKDPRTFAYFNAVGVESLLVVPLRDNGRFVGCIGADNFKLAEDVDVPRILETISPFLATVISNNQLLEELEWSVTHDMLTGLMNRRGVDTALSEYLDNKDATFALALIDIDDFKKINDNYGHAVGDEALTIIAQAMRDTFPDNAILGRHGGDELVAILLGESANAADELFERLSQANLVVEHENPIVKLTLSIGYTVFPKPAETIHMAFNQADVALYDVKHSGKAKARRY